MTRPTLASPLDFRCTSCGHCCRALRVAVTSFDVARLRRATSLPAEDLVVFLAPHEVDMTGEPDSFVELSEGRRLMVLAQQNGACRLLGEDGRCRSYAARPRDCAAFPFDFGLPQAAPHLRRLELLPLEGCELETGGQQLESELRATDDARWSELAAYQALVARWNRRAFHRKRLGRAVGSARDFLERALADGATAPPTKSDR